MSASRSTVFPLHILGMSVEELGHSFCTQLGSSYSTQGESFEFEFEFDLGAGADECVRVHTPGCSACDTRKGSSFLDHLMDSILVAAFDFSEGQVRAAIDVLLANAGPCCPYTQNGLTALGWVVKSIRDNGLCLLAGIEAVDCLCSASWEIEDEPVLLLCLPLFLTKATLTNNTGLLDYLLDKGACPSRAFPLLDKRRVSAFDIVICALNDGANLSGVIGLLLKFLLACNESSPCPDTLWTVIAKVLASDSGELVPPTLHLIQLMVEKGKLDVQSTPSLLGLIKAPLIFYVVLLTFHVGVEIKSGDARQDPANAISALKCGLAAIACLFDSGATVENLPLLSLCVVGVMHPSTQDLSMDVMECLLNNGVPMDVTPFETSEHNAELRGMYVPPLMLLADSLMYTLSVEGSQRCLEHLIVDRNADVNTDDNGRIFLLTMLSNVEVLLAEGGHSSRTRLDACVYLTRVIVQKGAKVDVVDETGASPAFVVLRMFQLPAASAIKDELVEIFALMVSNGLEVNEHCGGQYLLDVAIDLRNPSVITLLQSKGAISSHPFPETPDVRREMESPEAAVPLVDGDIPLDGASFSDESVPTNERVPTIPVIALQQPCDTPTGAVPLVDGDIPLDGASFSDESVPTNEGPTLRVPTIPVMTLQQPCDTPRGAAPRDRRGARVRRRQLSKALTPRVRQLVDDGVPSVVPRPSAVKNNPRRHCMPGGTSVLDAGLITDANGFVSRSLGSLFGKWVEVNFNQILPLILLLSGATIGLCLHDGCM